nr:MAG TPA: hypothetical protein [Caudoviricetes sp.]
MIFTMSIHFWMMFFMPMILKIMNGMAKNTCRS